MVCQLTTAFCCPCSFQTASQARRSYYQKGAAALDDDDDDELTTQQRSRRKIFKIGSLIVKLTTFIVLWSFFSIVLIFTPTHKHNAQVLPLKPQQTKIVEIQGEPSRDEISIRLRGNIDVDATQSPKLVTEKQKHFFVTLVRYNMMTNLTVWQLKPWKVYLLDVSRQKLTTLHKRFKVTDDMRKSLIKSQEQRKDSDTKLRLSFLNSGDETIAIALAINTNPLDLTLGVVSAAFLLFFMYALIIWDITDRTFAAILMSTTAIGVLAVTGERPTLKTIISWIDMDTLLLLFSTMLIVGVMTETGVFEYCSVLTYRISKGQPWLLVFLLCLLTALISAFLDNVTIIMLMVPIVIRLSECMGLRTTALIICVAIFTNIGGMLTPVGDPPNVIITANPYVLDKGVDFIGFCLHMLPGVLLSCLFTWCYLYLVLRQRLFKGASDQMRKSIKSLQNHVDKIKGPTTDDENTRRDIMVRIEELQLQYKRNAGVTSFGPRPAADFVERLAEMEAKYKLHNKPLLVKCCISLGFGIVLFLLGSLSFMAGLTLAWSSFLAAMLLLILADKPDMNSVLQYVEWPTLLFFGALFVFIEACAELGLIDWVSEQTVAIILNVATEYRTQAAILLVLWISAIISALVDNIPIVTMMLKLAIRLSLHDELEIPLMPMVWALCFGVCLGGNATLIAASSNVVAAGLASQYGYEVTFREFFNYGAPVMMITCVVVSIYLLVAHGLFTWH
ncbi:P protein-like [Drosophila grimshawi]|uniref:P protein-like n=1 Tax=Drosophila grimshawi TaxID=7222 RepID=UPI0013EF04B4|nr:P protein-like [Drosophila grimshawi]